MLRRVASRSNGDGKGRSGPAPGKPRGERGQSLVNFIFALGALMGFAALTIDVGMAYVARRDMQNAADAAALAGADVLLEGHPPAVAVDAAQDMALQNGYDDSLSDVSLAVNIPPTSGPHSGDGDYVEVVIGDQVSTRLARVLGKDMWDIGARAVAAIDRTPKPYAIIALNESACQAMHIEGNSTLTITDAGTFTNSECHPDAFYAEGSIFVDDDTNHVVGGWEIVGQAQVDPPPSRAGHYGDPLADVPVPTPTAGPPRACPTFGGAPGTRTLQPGVYDCTIDPPGQWGLEFLPGDYHVTGGIVADGGGDITFGAGMYFLQGEGLVITGNGFVEGIGVTFYIDEGQALLTGTSGTNLAPPDSGDYEGILIFQNRSLTSTVQLSGNFVGSLEGIAYAPAAEIRVVGSATTSFQFIADTFNLAGNADITIDYNGNMALGVPAVHLVE